MHRRMLLVFAAVLLLACKAEATGGAPGDGGDDAKYYTMAVEPVAVAAGAAGALKVVITAQAGLHWNEEFPARFAVEGAETPLVRFGKTEVKKGDPEIQVSEKKDVVSVSLPLTAKAAGDGHVAAKLSFSLCTDKTCHIFRNRDVKAAVSVK